ncbi:MAG: hypothetical protein HON56_03360 [Nitrospina sp.]|nr:hypothetical protein [Nitrospina sp.]MBT4898086.1 hypothetical protein [Nitrospina sp.]MBT5261716.1 hypothetical protein [Nitrospina sp.]MBT6854190.1 hypothetical protein [Nitrospina sp.]
MILMALMISMLVGLGKGMGSPKKSPQEKPNHQISFEGHKKTKLLPRLASTVSFIEYICQYFIPIFR